jgi:uncharacterized protein with WD repeat
MKSERWVRNWLQINEDFLRKEEMSELSIEEMKKAAKDLRAITVPFILSVLYTGRNSALRQVLELNPVKKQKQKRKNNSRKLKREGEKYP